MFTVIQRKKVSTDVATLEVFSPRIAKAILPGQYLSVRATRESPLLVLPVSGWDVDKGTITLSVDRMNSDSRVLADNQQVSMLHELNGPLGKPSDLTLCNNRELINSRLLFVADHSGTAMALSQMKWLAGIGCKADVLVSANTKNELLFSSELERVCDNIYISTEDGSLGFHGPAAQLLEMLLHKEQTPYDLIITTGSLNMMRAITTTANGYGIPVTANFTSQLSENGEQAGTLRLSVDGEWKNVAFQGPEFYASALDFEYALRSLGIDLPVSDEVEMDAKILCMPEKTGKRLFVKLA